MLWAARNPRRFQPVFLNDERLENSPAAAREEYDGHPDGAPGGFLIRGG